MDRALNYIFFLILVCVLLLWAHASMRTTILIGILASFLFCGFVFFMGWLTRSGAEAAFVIGSLTFGLGGWPVVAALLIFFLSSAFISRNHSSGDDENVRRNGRQVWANGFWVVAWLLIVFFTKLPAFRIVAAAAIATAAADTWASEMGSQRFDVKTYNAKTRQVAAAGSEGGVSWPGLVASLAGSGLIAAIVYAGLSYTLGWFFCLWLAGFAGALFDSYVGAAVQGSTYSIKLPLLNWNQNILIDNDAVNFMATGFGSLLMLLLSLFFL